MRLLVVEDDEDLAGELVTGLERYGHTVEHVLDGQGALRRYADADLVLLDLGLPDLDGFEVCRRLREMSTVPIIAVTARSSELDRVLGLRLGADDYIVKPYGFAELLARVEAVMRRVGPATSTGRPPSERIEVSSLSIDVRERRVTCAGRDVALARKEFDVLALLASDPGALFSREKILQAVWSETWFGPTRTLDVHIANLRSKLGHRGWIETVRGVGFRLSTDDPT
ncbi:MAG: transcriptional regulator [Frankiales bacterium]|nr:transcriptional regulator [Frankiales bacterium]